MSLTEFNELTQSEIEAELEEAKKNDERKNEQYEKILKFLDIHFSLLSSIIYNSHYKHSVSVEEFRLLENEKQKFTTEQIALDAQLRAKAKENLAKKRRKRVLNGNQT